MKKKKTFQSKSLNQLTLLERLTWLIPTGFFLRDIWISRTNIVTILEADHSLPVIIAVMGILLFLVFIQSLIPFFLLKLLLHCARKQMIRNNTFQTMEDFEYYRDKLEGLSPGAISLISDLKLEPKKDIAASILKYKELGILREIDGNFVADHLEETSLRNSDRYLIKKLLDHSFSVEYDKEWRRLIEQEAMEDGYITRRGVQREAAKGCGTGCLIQIILLVAAIALLIHIAIVGTMEEFVTVLDHAPDGMLLGEQLKYLSQYPQYFSLIGEMIAALILFLLTFISPLALIAGMIGTVMNLKMFKRTALGNQMAECIYGMKNFIHDYSNLSEAMQEQIVLWDDYLIYAVVLEENQQIVDEIMNRRKKS